MYVINGNFIQFEDFSEGSHVLNGAPFFFETVSGENSYTATASDGFSFGEVGSNNAGLYSIALDGIGIAESRSNNLGASVSVSDGIKLADNAVSIALLIAIISDAISIGDSVNWESLNNYFATASDGIKVSDITIGGVSVNGLASDSFIFSDIKSTQVGFTVSLQDTVGFSDLLTNIALFSSQCSDAFKLGDAAITITANGKIEVSFSGSRVTLTFSSKSASAIFMGRKHVGINFTGN